MEEAKTGANAEDSPIQRQTDVEQRLAELYKVKDILTKVDYGTIKDLLNKFVPTLPIAEYDFKNEPFEFSRASHTNYIYRATLVDRKDDRWKRVDGINYVPASQRHKIIKYGRVNKPGESMFYGSLDHEAACFETFCKGDNMARYQSGEPMFCVVGAWQVVEPIRFARIPSPENYVIPFLQRDALKAFDLERMSPERIRDVNNHLRGLIGDEDKFALLEFFAEAFARMEINDDREYILSNYYADRVFHRVHGFRPESGNVAEKGPIVSEALQYYSLPSCYQHLNVAMEPTMADKKLKFSHANYIWISKGPKPLKPMEDDIPAKDGIIQWQYK